MEDIFVLRSYFLAILNFVVMLNLSHKSFLPYSEHAIQVEIVLARFCNNANPNYFITNLEKFYEIKTIFLQQVFLKLKSLYGSVDKQRRQLRITILKIVWNHLIDVQIWIKGLESIHLNKSH